MDSQDSHWKKKYFDSLEELEARERQWQQSEQVLRQLASRLTLAADQSDAALNRLLDRLREDLRRNRPVTRLAAHLEEINAAILRLDEQRRREEQRLPLATALSRLLDRIELPQGLRRKGKALHKQLAAAADDADPEPLIEAFASLIRESLDWLTETAPATDRKGLQTDGSTATGLFRRIFAGGEAAGGCDEAEAARRTGELLAAALSRIEVQGDPRAERDELIRQARNLDSEQAVRDWARRLDDWLERLAGCAGEPPNEVLIELLERLDLPESLADEVERLKKRLAGDLTPASLSRSIADLADLIARARSQVQQEKNEIERFLAELTSRLGEIDATLEGSREAHEAMVEERRAFDRRMSHEVRGMEDSVRTADELETLKRAIQQRLEHIQEHMQRWREKEQAREQRLREENEQLAAQLETFRREAVGLHDKLEAARQQAMRDVLTGLPNRMAWEERMESELARARRHGRPLTLAIIDVDFFKRINDRFGHQAGDRVLKILADLFREQTRASDFIARFGGEEFMLILPETDGPAALHVADKLRTRVADANFHYRDKPVPVTISCGLAEYREGDDIDRLYARADAALYRAKESGRNRCVLDGDA